MSPMKDLDYRTLNRCLDIDNKTVVCSSIWSPCYVYVEGGKPKRAGCVEPTTSWDILSHMNTHFCQNPHKFCLNPLDNFQDVLSCFHCSPRTKQSLCLKPQFFDVSNRGRCNNGTRRCVTYALGLEVLRGCEGEGLVGENCKLNPEKCRFCDTNYCNGLPLHENPVRCYSTRSHVAGSHSSVLKLIKCINPVAVDTEKPCYISRREKWPLIRAGCVADYEDRAKYFISAVGQPSIIFEDPLHCYKCKSSHYYRCYSTRWLDPHKCNGNSVSALRGCYTIFDLKNKRIERGCLSELDNHRAILCLGQHFELMCIFCTEHFCNTIRK